MPTDDVLWLVAQLREHLEQACRRIIAADPARSIIPARWDDTMDAADIYLAATPAQPSGVVNVSEQAARLSPPTRFGAPPAEASAVGRCICDGLRIVFDRKGRHRPCPACAPTALGEE